ncbi:FecR family protein [Candidatus Electronema sp. JM]|uniref:FecR family protein n=1 Tax=Candidatus Electronema sp. JM TaxID=3401571 RepID=UPI003AA7AD46
MQQILHAVFLACSVFFFFSSSNLLAAPPRTVVCPSDQELLQFLESEQKPSASLLPPSVSIAEGFTPGTTEKAGAIENVQGAVLVIHQGGTSAYRLKQNLPIFNGDTLITAPTSRVTMRLTDDSQLTLTANSKLVIDQAVYQSETGHRDTKLQLLLGRLRTIVSKVTGPSSFRIKTPNVVAGVRGTDFLLAVGPSLHSPSDLMTVLLTGGGGSRVELIGDTGNSVLVGPLSIASAALDCGVCPSLQIGNSTLNMLHNLAPELDFKGFWQVQLFLDDGKKLKADPTYQLKELINKPDENDKIVSPHAP